MSPAEMVTLALGGAAVIGDLRSRTIPNWLSRVRGGGWNLCGAWNGGARGAAMAVAGAGAGFAILLLFHLLGGLGGGDVKLMAAFGALLGPSDIVDRGRNRPRLPERCWRWSCCCGGRARRPFPTRPPS